MATRFMYGFDRPGFTRLSGQTGRDVYVLAYQLGSCLGKAQAGTPQGHQPVVYSCGWRYYHDRPQLHVYPPGKYAGNLPIALLEEDLATGYTHRRRH